MRNNYIMIEVPNDMFKMDSGSEFPINPLALGRPVVPVDPFELAQNRERIATKSKEDVMILSAIYKLEQEEGLTEEEIKALIKRLAELDPKLIEQYGRYRLEKYM